MRSRDERGVGVVLVLAMVAGLVALAGAGTGLAAVVVVHRRAQTAADLAAIAAAQGLRAGADSCAAADRIAEANGAKIESCAVDGLDVAVVVQIALPVVLGRRDLRARARAGPGGGD